MFAPLGFTIELAGPEAGTAAAVKMLRSVVTKDMEALIVDALTAASMAGVRTKALRGICDPMDATRYSKFVDMCVRTELSEQRRALEMEGVAEALREIGLQPIMTDATAARLRASAGLELRDDFSARPAYSARCARCLCRKDCRPVAPVAFGLRQGNAADGAPPIRPANSI